MARKVSPHLARGPFFLDEQNVNAPDYLSITGMLKATPREEGGERFVYLEASNEGLDQQGEVVMAKALEDSADMFLRYGNLDLDHITQIGAKLGISDYQLYEIGRPVAARFNGGRTFVKGQIYRGDGPVAEKANHFWDSLTRISPPSRWFPSVGGAILEKSVEAGKSLVKKVRWINIGFSKTPVNQHVPEVSTIPIGVFAKCWGPAGFDIGKALEAGYGTDSAALSGGGALRKQSLDKGISTYWEFREAIAEAARGMLKKVPARKWPQLLVDYAAKNLGLDRAEASEWVDRFLGDIKERVK